MLRPALPGPNQHRFTPGDDDDADYDKAARGAGEDEKDEEDLSPKQQRRREKQRAQREKQREQRRARRVEQAEHMKWVPVEAMGRWLGRPVPSPSPSGT